MASLDVQPRLTEARPDPDTPAQMRAAVARYLAANALKDKALSTEQQKKWAAREEKYRKEWEQIGVWVQSVTTGLTTAAWEHTLKGERMGCDKTRKHEEGTREGFSRLQEEEGEPSNSSSSISSYNTTPNPTQPYSTHPNSSYNTIHNYRNTRKFNNPSSIYKEIKAVPTKDSTDKDTWGARTPLTFKNKGENPQYVQGNPVNNDTSTGAVQKTHGTPAGATSGSRQEQQTSASQPATRGRSRTTKTDRRTKKTKTKDTSPNRSGDECSDGDGADLIAPLMTDAWDREIFSSWRMLMPHQQETFPQVTPLPEWLRQGGNPTAYAAYVAAAMQQSGQQKQNHPYRGGGPGRGRERPIRQYPCMHCSQMGHWIKDCPKYHSDMAQSRFPSQQQNQNTGLKDLPATGNSMLTLQQ
ncbi:unnamed protein product [Arctogadus glacialis]